MNEITCWLGYFIVAAAAIAITATLMGYALNLFWEKIRDGRNLWWINKAIQHYEKIEPRPIKDKS